MLDGTILEVMECWPLELLVRAEHGECTIGLTEEAVVSERGQSVPHGALVPGTVIRARLIRPLGASQATLTDRVEIVS